MSHITNSILLQLHAATKCALTVAQAVLQTETEFEWGKLISDLSQKCTGRGAAPLSLVLWDSYFEGRPNSRKETFFFDLIEMSEVISDWYLEIWLIGIRKDLKPKHAIC